MNDLQSQRDEMFMDKNVTACNLPEIVVCNNKELTYNVVKDICVDEGVPTTHEKFLFNEKDSANPSDSKSSKDNKLEEFVDSQDPHKVDQDNLIANGEEAKDDSEVYHEVRCKNTSLKDVISMDDSQNPPNKSSISQHEENVDRETEQEKTEEPKAESLRYLSSETSDLKKPLLNNVMEDSYDHHNLIFSRNFQNGFGDRSFSEAESGLARITSSGHIGNLSVRSDGSSISGRSFAFPILQSEWNSSPIRMVKADKRQRRKEKGWRHCSLLLCCRF